MLALYILAYGFIIHLITMASCREQEQYSTDHYEVLGILVLVAGAVLLGFDWKTK